LESVTKSSKRSHLIVLYHSVFFFLTTATAANIRVGQLLGANKPNEALNAAKVSAVISCMWFSLSRTNK